jgi:hypothetical protein
MVVCHAEERMFPKDKAYWTRNETIPSLLKVKDLGEGKNFVGCCLVHSKDEKTIHILEPKHLKNLEDSFSNSSIPVGAPKAVVMRPEKGDDVLSPKDQT